MSIWDEIKNNMTDAANFTIKKTGEYTNLAKLNVTLHSEKNKLDGCFEEIGKLYYEYQRNGTDYVAEIADLITEADIIKATIAGLEVDVAKLRKSVICPACGCRVGAEMTFCPGCGAKQEKQTEPEEDKSDENNTEL